MTKLHHSLLLASFTLSVSLAGGCADLRTHARAINEAAVEKREADAAFDAHQAETQANADAGWVEGVRLYEAFMASPGPEQPAENYEQAQAWWQEREAAINEVDAQFAHVQVSEESEKAFETHLMMGDMFRKVVDELIAFEPKLTVEENKMLNTMCTMYAIDYAQGHYDAWDKAYAEFHADLEDELQERIAYGRAQRDALDPIFDRNRAINQDTLKVGRDAPAQ